LWPSDHFLGHPSLIFEIFAVPSEIPYLKQHLGGVYKMASYEEYIPLVQLYPRTFARIETPISILALMSEVVITNNFVPPDRLADEWEEALDEYADFMAAAPGLKLRRKLNALKKVLNAWVRRFHNLSQLWRPFNFHIDAFVAPIRPQIRRWRGEFRDDVVRTREQD
jgi:hypothetical protein